MPTSLLSVINKAVPWVWGLGAVPWLFNIYYIHHDFSKLLVSLFSAVPVLLIDYSRHLKRNVNVNRRALLSERRTRWVGEKLRGESSSWP